MHRFLQRRAHPELNQGPSDLQSAALTTELYTRDNEYRIILQIEDADQLGGNEKGPAEI